eukprot:889019-Rhodomonas_salina.1
MRGTEAGDGGIILCIYHTKCGTGVGYGGKTRAVLSTEAGYGGTTGEAAGAEHRQCRGAPDRQ